MIKRALFLGLMIVLGCDFSAAVTRAKGHHRHHSKVKVKQSSLSLSSTPKHQRRWRRIFWNPVFRPSHDSLLKQNAEIDRLELPRIQDDAELEQLKMDGKLVPIMPSAALRVDPRLDPDRRYCRPWTLKFVEDLAAAYHEQFGDQIQVNSAVRTVVVQKKLRRHNRNAAPAEGETASSHLAGLTVDLQRRGMSKAEIKWVENYLVPMKAAGLVEPEEERRQWVFHIMVSDRYADPRDGTEVAQGGDDDEVDDDLQPPLLQRASQSSLADAPGFLLTNGSTSTGVSSAAAGVGVGTSVGSSAATSAGTSAVPAGAPLLPVPEAAPKSVAPGATPVAVPAGSANPGGR